MLTNIRACRDDDRATILAIVNAAAEAYRGVIPADRWHEPYMSRDELDREIAAGVAFSPQDVLEYPGSADRSLGGARKSAGRQGVRGR